MSSPSSSESTSPAHRRRSPHQPRPHLATNSSTHAVLIPHDLPAAAHTLAENGTNGTDGTNGTNGTNGRQPSVVAAAETKRPAPKTTRRKARRNPADRSPLARVEVAAGESWSLELFAGSHRIISGEWPPPRVTIDGHTLSPQSSWEELCVLRTDVADYWEFEMCLGEPWCVQRQIMFARNEQFLLIADKVLGAESAASRKGP